MGLPMVKRLVSLGYAVRAYDIVPAQNDRRAARRRAAAATRPPTPRAAPISCCSTCRRPTRSSRRCSAPSGVASALAPPQLVVDFSTVKVDKGRAFAARLREATGCGWVDAPVSGGPPASGTGTLTVMAGGDAADIARVAPLMARRRERASRTWGRPARARRQDDQPAHRRLHARGDGRGAAARGSRGHRRRAHSRMPRRRPRRRHAAAAALSAHGRARLRAAGLRAPAAEGPRDGQRVRRRPEGAGADDRRGAVAVPDADPPRATPSSTRRRCSSSTKRDAHGARAVHATTGARRPIPTEGGMSCNRSSASCCRRCGARRCRPARRAAAHAQIKLRYAHVGVANAPQTLYADEVAKLVKERTNGRVEIQVFPNSQLGGVGELVDGVKSGAISMGHHDFASLGKIVAEHRGVQHAVRLPRPGARAARDRPAHVAGAAEDQPAAGREGQHAHHRRASSRARAS